MRLFVIPFCLSICLFFPKILPAQICGCAGEGNCPIIIPSNEATQVCYNITDAFNNNLADPSQGVCGVSVTFRHGNVGQQELTLCSPDGTCVQLTGDICAGAFTALATWDVLFVPCDSVPAPDPNHPPQWENCPSSPPFTTPWGNALYSGSYHPFIGCLEDFNSGPANGEWCLTMENASPFNSGQILDFEVILCDDSGLLCCDADGGSLSLIGDISACNGDTSLVLHPIPQYGAVEPDTTEYGYFFVISENNQIIEYQSDSIDLISYSPGEYEICGLSFSLAEETLIPAPNTGVSFADLTDLLNGATPPFCGDASIGCFTVLISAPIPPVDLVEVICEGDCFMVGTDCFSEPGNYSMTLIATNNCDSLVNLDLTVLEADTIHLEEIICDGDSLMVGDSTYFETGIFETILTSFIDCDSTIILTLTILDPITTNLTETICAGDTIWIDDNPYTETGNFIDTLPSFEFQCDSIISLDLTVINLNAEINPSGSLTCNQNTLVLDGSNSSNDLNITYLWTTNDGNFISPINENTIEIDSAGTYFLIVSDGLCEVVDSIIISANFDQPLAIASSSNDINCSETTAILNGTTSLPSPGNNLNYSWSSQNGCPILNPNDDMITVGCADIFTLIVENDTNGCTDTISLEIFENLEQPNANAGADDLLTCIDTCLNLNATNSQPANTLNYFWTTIDGNIKNGENTPTPQINDDGEYQLIIENQLNSCRDTDFVQINFDTLSPNIEFILTEPDTLTCMDSIINLMANDLNGILTLNYDWTGIETGQGTAAVTIENSGQINLILINTANGCIDEDSISIAENIEFPIADAADSDTLLLSCVKSSWLLGSDNSSIGPEFSYSWSTDIGHFITSPNSLHPSADSVGNYILTVTNNITGCTATDLVVLDSNYQTPIAAIGPDGFIDCESPDHTFTAFLGDDIWLYEWFLNGSLIEIGVNLNEVTINDTGMVVLVTTGQQPFACAVADTAFIIQTDELPIVNAGPDVFLDCETGLAFLDGQNTPITDNTTFEWQNLDGSFFANEDLLQHVTEIGSYILEVTDLTTSCQARDTVSVILDTIACTPFVFAGLDSLVNCFNSQIEIAAAASVGENIIYEWTDCDGNPLTVNPSDIFNPIFSGGCFVFSVTDTLWNFSVSDTILIDDQRIIPIAELGDSIINLTCPQLENCYLIDASASSQGPEFCYNWVSPNGEICTNITSLNIEILGEGVYTLEILNKDNGCLNSDAVLIQQLGESPIADAGNPFILECGISIDTLDGTNSFLPPNSEICWFSNTGTILSGKNTLHPIVEGSGMDDTFLLVISNPINLCTDTAFMILEEPDCFPVCEILFPEVLTCNLDTICLEASQNSISPENCYQWTTLLNGNIITDDTLSKIQITAAGFYELAITRKINGAQFTTTCQVQVTENITPPIANAGDNQFITCSNTCVTLDGSQSSSNASYFWTTTDGNIKSGEMTNQAEVDQIGTYLLTVTDLQNGCTATDEVEVDENFDTPIVDAGDDQMLSCSGTVSLFGNSTPSNNSLVTIQWTTDDGNCLVGCNTLSPIVTSVGTYYLEVTDNNSGCIAIDSVEVTPDNLSISCDIINEDTLYLNCLETDFQLVATASTQPGSIIIETFWSSQNDCLIGNVNGLTLDIDCADNYVFTAIDNNGCLCTRQITVLMDTLPPIADAGMDLELNCENPTAILNGNNSISQSIHSGTGDLNYNWTTIGGEFKTAQNIPAPSVCAGGLYILEIFDPTSNCNSMDTVLVSEVFQLPLINLMGDTTLTCIRDTANLSGLGSSSGFPFSHCWTTNDGNILGDNCELDITVNLPAFYVLTVRDTLNSCEVSDSIFVAMDTIPPFAIIDDSEILTVTCGTPAVSIDGSNSGSLDSLLFSWTSLDGHFVSPSIGQTVIVDSSGLYTLTISHLRNGCVDSMSFPVFEDFDAPTVNFAAAPILTCAMPEVQLEVLPPTNENIYTYQWNAPSGAICNGSNTANPTVKESVTYSVTITNSENGCTNQNSLFVNQDVSPPIAQASVDGSLDCIQTTANVSGNGSTTGAISYSWTTNSGGTIQNPNNLNTQVNAAGIYFIEVMNNGNGCADTAFVEVVATAVPILDALINVEQPTCLNSQGAIVIDTVIGGTAPFVYALNNDIFNGFPQFNFLNIGNYNLTIEDASGCTWDLEIALEPPTEVLVTLGTDIELTLSDSTTLVAQINIPISEIDTIIWSPLPNLDCPMCLEQGIRPLETTTYSIQVKSKDGCESTDKIIVLVDERPHLFAPNVFSPNGDGNNDTFYFQADETIAEIKDLQIFDRWGNMVFHETEFLPNESSKGWDGIFMGETMNPQVFVWKAEVIFRDGRLEVIYGDFVLRR